jgi:predicted transcriptional regulator
MAKDLVMAHMQAGQLLPEDMQNALHRTYASLMALKAQEETGVVSPVRISEATPDWKKSITKHTVICLECGATFKQLSIRHLRDHDLDARSYRAKYGIPRTQPLAAKDTTAMRKKIVQRVRPWEKAPAYQKSKGGKTTVAKRTGRKRTSRAKG